MFLFLMVLVKTITHSILWVEKKSGDVLAAFVCLQDLRPIGARPQGSPTLGGPERKRSGGKRVRRGAV